MTDNQEEHDEGSEPGPVPPFTMRQFWKMCDAHMSDPVPLGKADLSKPFVYDRAYGLFYVPFGMHQTAMSLLLAFHHGCHDGIDVSYKLGLRYSEGTADAFLETLPGTAFMSSQKNRKGERIILAGRRGNLSPLELRFFDNNVVYSLQDRN